MGNGPRRRRAKAWTWVYFALFGSDDEQTDAETESTDQTGEAEPETLDGPETK